MIGLVVYQCACVQSDKLHIPPNIHSQFLVYCTGGAFILKYIFFYPTFIDVQSFHLHLIRYSHAHVHLCGAGLVDWDRQ